MPCPRLRQDVQPPRQPEPAPARTQGLQALLKRFVIVAFTVHDLLRTPCSVLTLARTAYTLGHACTSSPSSLSLCPSPRLFYIVSPPCWIALPVVLAPHSVVALFLGSLLALLARRIARIPCRMHSFFPRSPDPPGSHSTIPPLPHIPLDRLSWLSLLPDPITTVPYVLVSFITPHAIVPSTMPTPSAMYITIHTHPSPRPAYFL